ncbi:isocitrate dehydrogenase [Leptospira ryugenii]|uniref:Isocitrate dehydrogenase [NADP] n=1 Tax=Leptospira ryugenii TaxID=1917863 RepID=A0A2P2DZM9_9LEPT|nr:NADP-dependent isocitrate dehydrogenase [Leptospira ryugenii]GBF50094.1 isocitrate dehydrogenase [Leptospira ryugenii]
MAEKNVEQNGTTTISLIKGDGIGPEITDSVLRILEASGANLKFVEVEAGEKVYLSGKTSGIADSAWDVMRKYPILLKGPITTPRGTGYKSLNVTIRKTLGLYANLRPARTYDPFVKTKHPGTDLVIVRENEEDTYAGIEHRQTREVTQCLKLITKPGTEKIVRYAFEFARSNGRKKITCMVKDNIMKITDGLFASVFKQISEEYPEISTESMIIDIGAAHLANNPQRFDVILAPNLYGDILSDIAAEVTGSVGMCGSSNIGDSIAMFEAVHGSAPDIAGKDIANPTALIKAAVLMLVHVGMPEKANLVRNAVLKALEDGYRTADIFTGEANTQKVGTKAFTDAIIKRLGEKPKQLEVRELTRPKTVSLVKPKHLEVKKLVGVDVFIDEYENRNPETLGKKMDGIQNASLHLKMITNRGVKVYPQGQPETFLTDHFRCRFVVNEGKSVQPKDIVDLLSSFIGLGFDVIKTENLYTFDDKPGYSLGQGE